MATTQVRSNQVLDEGISRADLNVSVPGSAVVRKVLLSGSLAAQGLTLTSTGVDSGTGDVTLGGSISGSGGFNGGSWSAPNLNQFNSIWSEWIPAGNSVVVPGVKGIPAMTPVGTVTPRTIATANAFTRLKRIGYVGAAGAANTMCSLREGSNHVTLGDDTNGGFFFQGIFGCSDPATVASARQFFGLWGTSTAPTNQEPSGLINAIGIGHGAADTNLKIIASGPTAQPVIDLGANFPANTLSADGYQLTLFAPRTPTAAGYRVGWHVKRLGTAFTANGVLTGAVGTALPLLTTLLGFSAFRTNNTSTLTFGLDIGAIVWAEQLP